MDGSLLAGLGAASGAGADAMLCAAVALSALPSNAGQDPLSRWGRAHRDPAQPLWLPWLALATLGLASSFFALTHPLEYAAIFGQGISSHGPGFVVALRP